VNECKPLKRGKQTPGRAFYTTSRPFSPQPDCLRIVSQCNGSRSPHQRKEGEALLWSQAPAPAEGARLAAAPSLSPDGSKPMWRSEMLFV